MTLRELLTARVVLAVCIAVYYWCWARNGWANYFVSILTVLREILFCTMDAKGV